MFFCLVSEKIEENFFFFQIMRIISLTIEISVVIVIFSKEMDGGFHIVLLLGMRGCILNWASCVFR